MKSLAYEEVDLVDEEDSVVGSSNLGECIARGLLHRAVAVLVVRSSSMYVLQRRSKRDLWHPGMLTISSTGHVKRSETYDAAAERELLEELGLTAELTLRGKKLLPAMTYAGLTEHEWVSLYEAHTDLPCIIDPVELDSVPEVDKGELVKAMAGDSMTPDAVLLLRGYLDNRLQGRRPGSSR